MKYIAVKVSMQTMCHAWIPLKHEAQLVARRGMRLEVM
jgi:hypothetical protein